MTYTVNRKLIECVLNTVTVLPIYFTLDLTRVTRSNMTFASYSVKLGVITDDKLMLKGTRQGHIYITDM